MSLKNLKSGVREIAGVAANVVAMLLRLFQPFTHQILRFWRLAKLKSQSACPVPNTTQLDGKVSVLGTGQLVLGEYCRIGPDVVFETQQSGKITLGNHVRINQGTHIIAYDAITVGDDCLIGEYCSLRDGNHGINASTLIRLQPHASQPITIEEDCWIARGVTLLKGATLRKGAVIGANAIVNYEVAAGQVIVSPIGSYLKDRN